MNLPVLSPVKKTYKATIGGSVCEEIEDRTANKKNTNKINLNHCSQTIKLVYSQNALLSADSVDRQQRSMNS